MKTVSRASSLAVVLLTSLARSVVDAQENVTNATTAMLCSCSPTEITFVISLDQTCLDNDIVLNTGGIDGAFCFTETGVALPAPPASDNATATTSPSTALTAAPVGATTVDATAANVTDVPADDTDEESVRFRSLQTTTTTSEEDPVVEVVSVQYLEFDTSGDLTVINQDDTYASVSLVNGDRVKFVSASSYLDVGTPLVDQMSSPALVPGGASLIIYGKTASGVVVRNRFFWMYDTANCVSDNVPVKVDDEIGWVTVAEISNAWPIFCPALPDGSPTISPKTNEPTLTPSKMPTTTPQFMSMSGWDYSSDVGGESSWGAATQPPSTQGSQVIIPDSDDGSGEVNVTVFASKGGKLEAKTYKPHSKSSKSKSGKSKGGKSIEGKTGKDDDWWGGAYSTGKVVEYDVTRNVGTHTHGWGSSVAVMVVSLMAGAMLMARQ